MGNEINLAVPSEKRSEYFAVWDIFLYGAIAVSTYASGKIIEYTKIEYIYVILSIGFVISKNPLVFLTGYGISLLKDMFAPVSFGYMYHCIEKLGKPEDAPVVLGLLTTISNVANICIPLVVGIYWKQCFVPILFVSAGCLLVAVLVGAWILLVDQN